MGSAIRIALLIALAALLLHALPASAGEAGAGQVTDEQWASMKERFDAVCEKVEGAPSLTLEEITKLKTEAEALRELYAASGRSEAKIFTFRLDKCIRFYSFMIDLRNSATNPEK